MANRLRQTVQSIEGTPAEELDLKPGAVSDPVGAARVVAEMLPGSGFVTGVQKGGAEGGIDILAELLGIAGGIGGAVAGPPGVVGGYTLGKGGVKGLRSLLKSSENISVFPKPERMFPEGQRPKGGEYLNPKTGDVLTNKNVESASISITPEGKPKFDASPVEKEVVGSPSTKGATQIKTNLFKKSAGWKWLDGPVEYKDIPTLVSVQNKGKHYYALEANFPEGVNLTRYADAPSEPRLRPTVKGFVDLGKQIGTISVRGKEHPVYDKIVNRYAGGSVVERNPYNYQAKAI